ncbi:MAG: hypothetical protein EPN86_00160 [Nanoarchaeota archaeon]|nr:MAG: hypothetical protein EPN86_00160 [Nanoarchaeota archaeon]
MTTRVEAPLAPRFVEGLDDLLRNEKPFDLLVHIVGARGHIAGKYVPDKHYHDVLQHLPLESQLIDYLVSQGVRIREITYVTTDERPGGNQEFDKQGGYFNGVYANEFRQILQIFSGAELRADHPLLIVSARHQQGLFFTGILNLLESQFDRKFDDSVPTIAYFREVRNPQTGEVTMRNVYTPVIDGRDVQSVPWSGRIPLKEGRFNFDRELK